MLETFQWDKSEPDIFLEGRNEGASFCDLTCSHQYIACIQGSSSSSLLLLLTLPEEEGGEKYLYEQALIYNHNIRLILVLVF